VASELTLAQPTLAQTPELHDGIMLPDDPGRLSQAK